MTSTDLFWDAAMHCLETIALMDEATNCLGGAADAHAQAVTTGDAISLHHLSELVPTLEQLRNAATAIHAAAVGAIAAIQSPPPTPRHHTESEN